MANIGRTPFQPCPLALRRHRRHAKRAFRAPALGQMQMQIKMDLKKNYHAHTVHADIPAWREGGRHPHPQRRQPDFDQCRNQGWKRMCGKARKYCVPRTTAARWSAASPVHDVDEASAQARYSDGVLEMTC